MNNFYNEREFNLDLMRRILGTNVVEVSSNTPASEVFTKSLEKYFRNIICVKNSLLEVIDVNVIVPNKVVEVVFSDGTKEKAVCQDPDVFSLETAISICISKKIMGGSSAYNNTIKHAIKTYMNKLDKEAADKAEQERIEKKRAKRLAYKERRAAKREAAEKERQIEIQKEAYIRAMEYMKGKQE